MSIIPTLDKIQDLVDSAQAKAQIRTLSPDQVAQAREVFLALRRYCRRHGYQGLLLTVNGGGAPGCLAAMSDPECGAVFDRLGLDLSTGEPKPGQTFFRTE